MPNRPNPVLFVYSPLSQRSRHKKRFIHSYTYSMSKDGCSPSTYCMFRVMCAIQIICTSATFKGTDGRVGHFFFLARLDRS